MGDVDEKDITTRDAGLSNRHNLQGGSSPRWHGNGLGHSQVNDNDGHSGWLTGIAQYGLKTDSEVTLSFDDTPKQIGLQWTVNTGSKANAETPTITSSATFAPDEHILELGVLRHRYSNHQSSDSGQGINLASDHGLQITGESGVLLSTFGIRHSQSEHESAWVNDAGQRQLKIGTELSETFKEAKQAHLQSTAALSNANQTIEAFKTSAQIIDETLNTEVLGAADVMLVSKDSILASANNTLWTAKTIVRQSGSTQSDVVAGNYMLTANTIDSLSGVGGQASSDQNGSGLHISANREPLAIQAQGGELQLHSQQGMTIGSESGQLNISSPRRIKLQTSAGASLTIDDSGIKLVCPGTIKVKAVKKSLVAGGMSQTKVLQFVDSVIERNNYLVDNDTGKVLRNRRYRLIDALTGDVVLGKSDGAGKVDEYQPDMIFEILPEMGRTYSQDVGAVPPVLVEEDFAAAASKGKGKVLTAKEISTEKKVIDELKLKDASFKKDYDQYIKDGGELDSVPIVPIVPDGAKIITFNNLLKLKPKTGSTGNYKYINGFAANETTFHDTIKKILDDGYLPNQYFYIFAHASSKSLRVGSNYINISQHPTASEKKKAVSAFVKDLIEKQGYVKNKTLILVSCNAGNGTSKTIGQFLSEHKDIGTVYAPTSLTWYSPSPRLYSCARWKNITGKSSERRMLGHFRIFNSAPIK
ncbi:Rhs element Vgr protein [Psychrobacter sp. DAB_AL43B]|nr:Rhs element Vgr protein [Psychrobacter sp. DAB_AL43B]